MAHPSHLSRFVTVWSGLQAQVARGRLPGFAAAVRYRGVTEVHAGGCLELGGTTPVRPDSLFRLASLSKPFAGVLALSVVEDGLLGLDDPVSRWLPELAEPRVLVDRAGRLDDTVPAERPITVRHLLTSTPGFGGLWDDSPLDQAVHAAGLGPGPLPPELVPEEYLARLGELPLAAQPGASWLYHLSTEVLSVLLARVAGQPLHELLHARVTGPLGLADTGFWATDPARLGPAYLPDGAGFELIDPADGRSSRPPVFEGLAAGLVSSAPDVLAFFAALADGGAPVLGPGSVAALTSDALTGAQRAEAATFLGAGRSWGLQVGVQVEAAEPWAQPGRWGWDGGTGTTAYADPDRDLVAVLLTARGTSPAESFLGDFWQAVHRCL
ncbi:serine hydrolase domain-containing protein [Modestobacter versicolor]|uniref:CubicO group peptidase (Beta-lactamase class C family) n=1 Tax=Modestobacter versicolor TaxID=429133 RepID=A0A323VSD9_9ACTN|nr:serine hydrolase domain-containing protein [Modestobacter versicolor]MBB3674935.1 CubicO group peptidase (beta-lactamase class C family) [Modestobacter versicolor]PZA21988.1 penicillin-binding protein [Modestobacter versicolor]